MLSCQGSSADCACPSVVKIAVLLQSCGSCDDDSALLEVEAEELEVESVEVLVCRGCGRLAMNEVWSGTCSVAVSVLVCDGPDLVAS